MVAIDKGGEVWISLIILKQINTGGSKSTVDDHRIFRDDSQNRNKPGILDSECSNDLGDSGNNNSMRPFFLLFCRWKFPEQIAELFNYQMFKHHSHHQPSTVNDYRLSHES